jgi:putative ABC transport system permease protein
VTATYEGATHDLGQLVGTYPSYFEASNSAIDGGTYFTNDDVLEARKVVVLGRSVVDDLFGSVDPIGKQVSIDGILFQVVGVLEDKGSTGFQDANDVAIAPLSTLQQTLTGYGALSQILVQATSADDVDAAEAEITAILDNELDVADPTSSPYQILNQSQLLETSSETTQTFTVLLGVVAGLSLLVGGIGITNIMLASITERIREIGVRRAIGAKSRHIFTQIVVESTVIAIFGGLLGIAAALGLMEIIEVATKGDSAPIVDWMAALMSFGFAVFIGIISGLYPALSASRIEPIEALRYG